MADEHPDSLPGMKDWPDRALIERLQADPCDLAAAQELWQRHSETVHRVLKRKIMAGGLCPTGWDAGTFLDSCFSMAYENFTNRISKFEFRGSLDGWLAQLATTTAVDEFRRVTKIRAEPQKGTDEFGKQTRERPRPSEREVQLDEKDLAGLETARIHPTVQKELEKDDRKSVIRKLLKGHASQSDDDLVCSVAIRLRYWRSFTLAAIAAEFWGAAADDRAKNAGEQAVRRILLEDYPQLKQSLAQMYGIHSLPEI